MKTLFILLLFSSSKFKAVILLSPSIISPFSSSANNFILSKVTGKTLPVIAKIFEVSCIPRIKSLYISAIATKNKLPKLCPFRFPSLNLYFINLSIDFSVFAREIKQALISPGGITPKSSLSIPELPPSSATVTIAVISLKYFFKPLRIVELPVPPPMVTILVSSTIVFHPCEKY